MKEKLGRLYDLMGGGRGHANSLCPSGWWFIHLYSHKIQKQV